MVFFVHTNVPLPRVEIKLHVFLYRVDLFFSYIDNILQDIENILQDIEI